MAATEHTTKFVVGLGNPGRRYAKTRHNIGWMVLDVLRRRWNVESGRKVFNGKLYETGPIGPEDKPHRVKLFEPLTYMNCSGQAVKGLATYYGADNNDILIVLDDMALPTGAIRARETGSAGGHNGLGDIVRLLASKDIPRLRVGIGSPPPEIDSADYVLMKFRDDEKETIQEAIERAATAVEDWIAFGMKYVMDKYNRKTDQSDASQDS